MTVNLSMHALQTPQAVQTVQAIHAAQAAQVYQTHPMHQVAQMNPLASNPILPFPSYPSDIEQPMLVTNPIIMGPIHQQVVSQQLMQTYSEPVVNVLPAPMQSDTNMSAAEVENPSLPIDLLDASMAQLLDSINPVMSDGSNPSPPPPQVALPNQPFMGMNPMAQPIHIQQPLQRVPQNVLIMEQNAMSNNMVPTIIPSQPSTDPCTSYMTAAVAAAAGTAQADSQPLNPPQHLASVLSATHPSSSEEQKRIPLTRKKTVTDWSTISGMIPKGLPAAPNAPTKTAVKNEFSVAAQLVKRPRSLQEEPLSSASDATKIVIEPAQPDPAEEDLETKKLMRADRNRQSAHASRARKKQYMVDLERRVNSLSKENAILHVSQLTTLQERIDYENQLEAENETLRISMITKDCLISKMTTDLKCLSVAVEPSPGTVRRKTLDCSEFTREVREIKAELEKQKA